MALGDNYDSNSKDYKGKSSPEVYSKYSLSNTEDSVDPSKMSFTFWNGLLKISIAPFIESTSRYDYKNEGAIYLSYFKSKMLADEIDIYLEDPKAYTNQGVSSGQGNIMLSNGEDVTGQVAPSIVIRKTDPNTGAVESSFMYQFRTDYHYSMRNYDPEAVKFDKVYNDILELEVLRDILNQHYIEMSGASAYANIEYGKYNDSRIHTKIDAITAKLGIEYKKDKKYTKGRGNESAFDKAKGRNYSTADIEDIENNM